MGVKIKRIHLQPQWGLLPNYLWTLVVVVIIIIFISGSKDPGVIIIIM